MFQIPKRRNRIVIILLSTTLLLTISCNNEQPKKEKLYTNKVTLKESFKEKIAENHQENYMLMESSCLFCHQMTTSSKDQMAPTMKMVRSVYKEKYPNKTDFVKALVSFKANPSKDASLMPDEVKKYGVMPNSGLSEEDVEDIAAFLFDYKFD